MARRTGFIVALIMTLIGFASVPSMAQSGRTFYIDFSSGSNSNNGLSKSTPWKSHPYMRTCGGTAPSYTHVAGDHFIFKGGVSWPAACFAMVIPIGGSSASTVSGYNQAPTINGADYYGVDVTWFAGGSFTRPLFDMAGSYVASGGAAAVIQVSGSPSNFTFDDIEIAHQLGVNSCANASMYLQGANGVVIDRMYIHDWTVAGGISDSTVDHFNGSICGLNGTVSVYNTEMSDGAEPLGQQVGACFMYLVEVAYNNCHNTGEGALSTVGPFHDNQVHDLDGIQVQAIYSLSTHMNGYEADYAGHPSAFYNNYMYNMNVGFNVLCPGTAIYNNVISNVYNSGNGNALDGAIAVDTNCSGVSSSTSTLVYNNILDPNGTYGSGGSFRIFARTGGISGVVTLENNISINSSFDLSGATSTPIQITNSTMSASDAVSYGFTQANKYKPSSSDPSISGAGTNLSSLCSGNLAKLCQDASGAPWLGGSYNARTAAWDLGAFVTSGQSQSSSKPNPPTNLTATVQ